MKFLGLLIVSILIFNKNVMADPDESLNGNILKAHKEVYDPSSSYSDWDIIRQEQARKNTYNAERRAQNKRKREKTEAARNKSNKKITDFFLIQYLINAENKENEYIDEQNNIMNELGLNINENEYISYNRPAA